MVSRYINPSSYFLMNIDRLIDIEKSNVTKTKKKLFDSFRAAPLVRGSSQYYNQNNGNFIDEANSERINQTSRQLNNRMNNVNNNNNQQANQADVPRCVVCNII